MVVDSARGALMGRTSSSTPLTTASASARPTNTTNAYIRVSSLCDARRAAHLRSTARRTLGYRFVVTFFSGGGLFSRMDVDPALVTACQRGEPGALDQLIRATYGDVYALCRRMLADPEEASDATQEVFIRVMRSVLGFRGDAAFGTWLHRVTVNVCLTSLRRRSRA